MNSRDKPWANTPEVSFMGHIPGHFSRVLLTISQWDQFPRIMLNLCWISSLRVICRHSLSTIADGRGTSSESLQWGLVFSGCEKLIRITYSLVNTHIILAWSLSVYSPVASFAFSLSIVSSHCLATSYRHTGNETEPIRSRSTPIHFCLLRDGAPSGWLHRMRIEILRQTESHLQRKWWARNKPFGFIFITSEWLGNRVDWAIEI